MSCVEGRLAAADLGRGELHFDPACREERGGIRDGLRKDEVAEARGEELHAADGSRPGMHGSNLYQRPVGETTEALEGTKLIEPNPVVELFKTIVTKAADVASAALPKSK